MTLTKRERRILSGGDRRSFLSRALPLSPIGDIGTSTLTEQTGEIVTWSTPTDWDNAISEEFVSHASGTVSMVAGEDDWEDLSDGASAPSPWQASTGNVTNGRVQSGSLAYYCGGGANEVLRSDFPSVAYEGQIEFYYNETSSQSGACWGLLNSNGNLIVEMATGNAQRGFHSGGGDRTIGTPSQSYDTWHGWRIYNWDWANETFDIEWFDPSGNDSTQTYTGEPFANPASAIESYWVGSAKTDGSYGSWSTGSASDMWVDLCYGVLYESTITTGTKSFSSTTQPNLQNLTYSLNGGSVTLDVIGSPGTASEEVLTQSLTGSNGYSLSWSSSHSDFRIKATVGSGDRQTSPTISQLELANP